MKATKVSIKNVFFSVFKNSLAGVDKYTPVLDGVQIVVAGSVVVGIVPGAFVHVDGSVSTRDNADNSVSADSNMSDNNNLDHNRFSDTHLIYLHTWIFPYLKHGSYNNLPAPT